jgi:hypothetical protein
MTAVFAGAPVKTAFVRHRLHFLPRTPVAFARIMLYYPVKARPPQKTFGRGAHGGGAAADCLFY